MFENLKSGNIERKLIKLCRCVNELINNKYNKGLDEFIPNIEKYTQSYHYVWGDYDKDRLGHEFTIDNITYGFEDNAFVYVKVEDIIIFHNRSEHSCDGKFEEVPSGWNHKLPIEMIKQIKKDSKIINEYIKDIKNYIKQGDDTEAIIKHKQEQEKLNKIFCNKN